MKISYYLQAELNVKRLKFVGFSSKDNKVEYSRVGTLNSLFFFFTARKLRDKINKSTLPYNLIESKACRENHISKKLYNEKKLKFLFYK